VKGLEVEGSEMKMKMKGTYQDQDIIFIFGRESYLRAAQSEVVLFQQWKPCPAPPS